MVMYGKNYEYMGGGEEWSQYVERLEFYFTANSIENTTENAGRRKAILLSAIGGKTYGLLRDLLAPDRPSDKTYDEVVEMLKKQFQPKPSEIVMRYKFNARTRKSNETVSDYNDESIQRKLLSESNLTFQTAFDTAQGMETDEKEPSVLYTAKKGRFIIISPDLNHTEMKGIAIVVEVVTVHNRALTKTPDVTTVRK